MRVWTKGFCVLTTVGWFLVAGAETLFENWTDATAVARIDADGKAGWINAAPEKGQKKGRFLGMFGSKLADLTKVKLGFHEGRLVVDTTACDLSKPKAFIRVCFVMPVKDLPNGPKVDFAAEMKAPPGARWLIGHNGRFSEVSAPEDKLKGRKIPHYWNNRPVMAEDDAVHPQVYSHVVPPGLKNLQFDIRLETPGIFEFGRISWDLAKAVEVGAVDPKRNLLINGGAERGWYGTAMANTITYSETGAYLGQDGHWFTTSTVPALDTDEKHAGRASFRFHVDHDRDVIPAWGPYNMEFNQIPVVPGKPLVFTCWAKADKNGRRLNLRLNTSSGGTGAYIGNLRLTTTWKRYKLLVKSVGQKQNGCYGDLQPGFGLVTPRLDIVSPGTFWVDDCGVFQAEDGDAALEPICVSGTINKKSAVYRVGEKIEARLKLVNGLGFSVPRVNLRSRVLDFRGACVAETPARVVDLAEGGVEIVEPLALPENFRGPVQWLFTATAGQVTQETGFNFGVIDVPKSPLKRMGYNIPGNVNMDRLLDLMRDFRVGSVRLWDGKLSTEENLQKIDMFHRNGIDVLYCFQNAGVLPRNLRYLVVKDPTEWQNHIAHIVTNALGKVCGYEILNEPNARSGMGRNPDPGKYDLITTETDAWCIKVAAEAIRKYDRKTLIVGPTTCHTDLSWTLDVLGRGAAQYLDVLSEHPYCAFPEVPDYRRQVETLVREGTRMKGRPMPSWATERGKTTPSNPENGCIYPKDIEGASTIVRTMIVGFAGGSERYFDFQLGTHNCMISYINNHNGNPDNDYLSRPSCLPYAQRALMDLIEEAPMVKELEVGIASRAYVFDRGDHRVVAFWKFQGEPRTVTLPQAETVADFMGVRRSLRELRVDKFPQYLITTRNAEELVRLFVGLDFGPKAAAQPVEVREQTKVPYFEKEVDWTKTPVLALRPVTEDAKLGEPKPGDAAEVRLAWNRSGLKMRVAVKKAGFHPNGDALTTLWKGDSLQIAFDTMKNALAASTGYDDEDFEYDLASYKDKPAVYRRHASLPYHDSLHKPLGLIEDVQLDIDVKPGETVYTINFAPQAVSPFRLGKGESMRLSVGANLCDGRTRYGALALTPGLLVAKKHPYDFLEIVLDE